MSLLIPFTCGLPFHPSFLLLRSHLFSGVTVEFPFITRTLSPDMLKVLVSLVLKFLLD